MFFLSENFYFRKNSATFFKLSDNFFYNETYFSEFFLKLRRPKKQVSLVVVQVAQNVTIIFIKKVFNFIFFQFSVAFSVIRELHDGVEY